MSESDKSSWDSERVEQILTENEGDLTVQVIEKLVELLGSVRAEAIDWTWTVACNQHDQGRDPRLYEVPELHKAAIADLNPDRE